MSTTASENDVILNRVNLALAKSQRLIASWVPPKTAEELARTKTDEELEKEEQAIFTPVPDTLGLGAPLPKGSEDGSSNRKNLSSNDKLRKQLLSREMQKLGQKASVQSKRLPTTRQGPPLRHVNTKHNVVDESESEEEGRSSLGKRKKMPDSGITPVETTDVPEGADGKNAMRRSSARNQPASYLNEVLSARSRSGRKKIKTIS